jgi:hypothetical protein
MALEQEIRECLEDSGDTLKRPDTPWHITRPVFLALLSARYGRYGHNTPRVSQLVAIH